MTVVTAAALASWGLAVHAWVNAQALRVPPPSRRAAGLISVLIPARNEAKSIGTCVDAVLSSQDVDLEVVVLDDGSTDGTSQIVSEIAAGDARVRLVDGAPLPDGWLGKPHACQQLADAASAAAQLLVFLDADVVVAADGLARTAALVVDSGLDLVSPYPRQIAVTWAERAVQPLLQWSWLTFLPLRLAERSSSARLVAANGQLLACRRRAYEAVGGHAAVGEDVIEDVALAAAFKRAGFTATVADGTAIASCRMYDGWAALRDGYSKSLWSATRTTAGGAVLGWVLTWLYCVPAVAVVSQLARGRRPSAAGVLGYAGGVAGRLIAARKTGGRCGDALAHPVSVATLVGLLLRSHRHHRAGRLTWKGRPIAAGSRR